MRQRAHPDVERSVINLKCVSVAVSPQGPMYTSKVRTAEWSMSPREGLSLSFFISPGEASTVVQNGETSSTSSFHLSRKWEKNNFLL